MPWPGSRNRNTPQERAAPSRSPRPRILAGAIAKAGVDPTLEGRARQDALISAIATRRGYCTWDVDHASWVVTLHHPEEQTFHGRTRYGRTRSEGLVWCLV